MPRVSHLMLLGVFSAGLSFPFVFGQDEKNTSSIQLPLAIEKGTKLQYEVQVEKSKDKDPSISPAWLYELEIKGQSKGRWAVAISVTEVAKKKKAHDSGETAAPKSTQIGCTVDASGIVHDVPASAHSTKHLQRTLDFIFGSGLRAKGLADGEPVTLGRRGPRAASMSSDIVLRMTRGAKKNRITFDVYREKGSATAPAGSNGDAPDAKKTKPSGTAEYDAKTGLLHSMIMRSAPSKGTEGTRYSIRHVPVTKKK